MLGSFCSLHDFALAFPEPPTCFDTCAFARLNAPRTLEVRGYSAAGLGLVVGLRDDGLWHAPFSAPYASVSGLGDAAAFAEALAADFSSRLAVTLPPPLYGGDSWRQALVSRARSVVCDFNYHYPLDLFPSYEDHLSVMARRNFRRALRSPFVLEKTSDVEGVYGLIAAHHAALGYHMAMSLDDVARTAQVVPVDFFKVWLGDVLAGAAVFYRTAPGVAQLINWGDCLSLRPLRVMSFMAHSIFGYYHALGFRIVDMGPASVGGVKNVGLVDFKLSLGCVESLRPSLLF